MLPKKYRLRLTKDIERVAKTSHLFFTKRIILKFAPNQKTATRVTVLVSLKFSKNATKRNKIKRQIREIVRVELDKLKKGFDIIIQVKPTTTESTYQELTQDITYAFKNTRLYS